MKFKKLFALSSTLVVPVVLSSAVSCGTSTNSNNVTINENVELGFSTQSITTYLSLFDFTLSYSIENKLKKSFENIANATLESKTEQDVLKWAQESINNKTDEEIRQMVFLNAAKTAFYLEHNAQTPSPSDPVLGNEKDYQSILFDVQNFSYDRVNSTFSFNYITSYYQSNYNNLMQASYTLNYRFENIKVEISTVKFQNFILPVIKFSQEQPASASIKLVGYKNEINTSNQASEQINFVSKFLKDSSSLAFSNAKKMGTDLGKTNGKLIIGTMEESFSSYNPNWKPNDITEYLTSVSENFFSAFDLNSFTPDKTTLTQNISLSEATWMYLFGVDSIVDSKEYFNGKLVLKEVRPSKIAASNVFFIDVDTTTHLRNKWIAYKDSSSTPSTPVTPPNNNK